MGNGGGLRCGISGKEGGVGLGYRLTLKSRSGR